MELPLVGVAFCWVIGLVFFGCFAWDEVWPGSVRDGRKLIKRKRVEVANH